MNPIMHALFPSSPSTIMMVDTRPGDGAQSAGQTPPGRLPTSTQGVEEGVKKKGQYQVLTGCSTLVAGENKRIQPDQCNGKGHHEETVIVFHTGRWSGFMCV